MDNNDPIKTTSSRICARFREEDILNSTPIAQKRKMSSTLSQLTRSSSSSFSRRSSSLTSTITQTVIIEPRPKFTLYKINVHLVDDRWVVYRRYSDFVLLNKKLLKEFPNVSLSLPPKRWFRDNFDKTFIYKRQQGLHDFMSNLFSLKQLCDCRPVQQFFRLNDPPSPNEDLEASQMYCQSLEVSCHELKQFVNKQEMQITKLKSELEDIETYNRQTTYDKNTATTSLLLAKNSLEDQLKDLKSEINKKNEEISKLKEEYRQSEAYSNTIRLQERQKRDLKIRDDYKIFTDKQRQIDSIYQNIVTSLSDLSKVKIDVGGKSIDVKPAECASEKEAELKSLLLDSRQVLEKLYKEHIEYYRKELEEYKIQINKTEKLLQNNTIELEALKMHLENLHEQTSREILSRDQCIAQYQTDIYSQNHYIANLEQKYFYSLILGVKLNMALYGRDEDLLNLKLEPSKLFLEVRDCGVNIENWPSWIARKLPRCIH